MKDNDRNVFLILGVVFVVAMGIVIAGIVKGRHTPHASFAPQVVATEEITTPLAVDHVFVVHDDRRNVTCYVTSGRDTAISCIPDSKMKSHE